MRTLTTHRKQLTQRKPTTAAAPSRTRYIPSGRRDVEVWAEEGSALARHVLHGAPSPRREDVHLELADKVVGALREVPFVRIVTCFTRMEARVERCIRARPTATMVMFLQRADTQRGWRRGERRGGGGGGKGEDYCNMVLFSAKRKPKRTRHHKVARTSPTVPTGKCTTKAQA